MRPDGPVIVGHNAVVQPVRVLDGTPAVLRMGGDPSGDAAQAWRALRPWDGDGAVRLFAHDPEQDVTLLERLDETRNLDVLPVEEAVVVAGELRHRLIRQPIEGLRTVEELAVLWEGKLRAVEHLPAQLSDRVAALCRELGPGANEYLINPDLHHRNVLGAHREPWLVIDPMPLAGDREFGLASLIWGRLEEADTERLLDSLIDTGDLDRDLARSWTMVETTVKLMHADARIARNCETVARTLSC